MTPYNSVGSNGLSRPLTGELECTARSSTGRNRAPREGQRVGVIFRVVIGDAGTAAVNIRAAQGFRVDLLPGRGPHQRRTTEKNPPLGAHDDGVIGHGRHISATRGA